MADYFVHPQAIVESTDIGAGTRIWAFVHILKLVRIGSGCNICDHCFLEDEVVIGNDVTIKSFNYLCSGVTLENDVFIGSGVTFSNDRFPRSKRYVKFQSTLIERGASIGTNASIGPGITIGSYAMIGMGAVVTKSVKSYALIFGNPGRQHGWVDEKGQKLFSTGKLQWESPEGIRYQENENGLIRVSE